MFVIVFLGLQSRCLLPLFLDGLSEGQFLLLESRVSHLNLHHHSRAPVRNHSQCRHFASARAMVSVVGGWERQESIRFLQDTAWWWVAVCLSCTCRAFRRLLRSARRREVRGGCCWGLFCTRRLAERFAAGRPTP